MSAGLPLAWRLRAAATVAVVPPLVGLCSFAQLAGWLGRNGRRSRPDSTALDDRALARWVDRLLRSLPGPWAHTCLRRATVLYRLLRTAGRPVELVIGVRRDRTGAVAGHAWLTRDGTPYLEPDPAIPAQHTVIARFPAVHVPTT